MTHLWAHFHSSFCCSVHCSKNVFDAIQPFISPLPLCNPGAMLYCVFFSLPKRHITTKKHHIHQPCHPGPRVCPSSIHAEDEPWCYSKSSKSKIRIHILTMTPFLRIKEGHTGKTGSIITTHCSLGTVISPGALKE